MDRIKKKKISLVKAVACISKWHCVKIIHFTSIIDSAIDIMVYGISSAIIVAVVVDDDDEAFADASGDDIDYN